MHVTSCSVNPTTSCPGSSVTVTVKVQPDYFDIGTYDVRIYGRSGGSWSQIAQKTGTANPLGGEFTLTHTISIPSSAGSWYEIGAMDSAEGYAFPVKTTEVTLPPTSFYLGTISASPTSGYASLTVQFNHSGGYGFDIIRWKIYKGNDLSCTRNGQSFSHTFATPGYYYIYAIPIDRCGKEGPQKSLTVTVEERSTDCSSPYGRQGDYHCKGTTTKYQCNNGAWTPVEYKSTWCGYTPPPTSCSNPYGIPGGYTCQGTTRMQCNDGSWSPVEYNSPQCGGGQPEPDLGCTNPTGTAGDIICQGTMKVQCNGTQWVVLEENSWECGYIPPDENEDCTSPAGAHGSFRCSGTTRMLCDNGEWIPREYNSSECGYAPPENQDCTNPDGTSGSYRCSGTTRLMCNNGAWVIDAQNSEECGYTPGDPDDPDDPDDPGDPVGGCTNPAGQSGDVYCDGTTLKQCNGTTWAVLSYNSPTCGYIGTDPDLEPEPAGDTNLLLYAGVGLAAAIGVGLLLTRKQQH